MELKSKTALVTGAAIRVGKTIAEALAREGCNIVLHFGHSAKDAEKTALYIRDLYNVEVVTIQADLSSGGDISGIYDKLSRADIHLDILVNSAALFTESSLVSTTEEMWDNEFSVNLKAPFLLSKYFVKQLPEGQKGQIINMLDARSNRAGTDHFAYRLTKAALATMTQNLALELAPEIQVNGVALGAILPPPGKDTSHLNKIVQKRVPLKRSGSAEIVAENIIHLLKSEFLTGVILPIDGGEFL